MFFIEEVEKKIRSGEMTLSDLNGLINDLQRMAFSLEAMADARSDQGE
jgi:hypothetical protein